MGFWTPGRSNDKMHEYIGKNGLTLLLIPRKGLAVTTANITYHVGSRNEGLGLKGATHYLEHGMFKGSQHFHGKNGMWKLEEMGMYMNATTYTDRTNYFEVTETDHLYDAVVREADRMDAPLLTQELLDSEMTVVRNEFERGNNNDFEIAHKRMTATAFMAHPYHHSTIGWKSDIENVKAESLQEFHRTYYIPNNATYTFVGNFDPEKIKDMVEKAFSKIPKGKDIPEMYTKEPAQMGQRRVSIEKPTKTSLLGMGFKSVHGMHRDAIVNELLCLYLTDGPESVVEPLRKANNIHDVMASFERMKDPYLFTLWITTNFASKNSLLQAEDDIMHVLSNLKPPTVQHLDTMKQKLRFKWKNSMESTRGMASEVNEAIARGNAFDVYERFRVLDSIQASDLVRVSKQFDTRQSTVVHVLPGKAAPGEIDTTDYKMPAFKTSPVKLIAPEINQLNFAEQSIIDNTHSHTMYDSSKNHLRLSFQGQTNFTAREYVARLVLAQMLTKGVHFNNGSYDASEVKQMYDKNGIERNFSVSDYGIRVHFVSPLNTKCLTLLKKELQNPMLNNSDFEYIRSRLGSELRGSSSNVNTMANILLNQQLFSRGLHYRYSIHEMVSALNALTYNEVRDQHLNMLKGTSVMTTLGPKDISFNINEKGLKMEKSFKNSSPRDIQMNIPGKTSCTVLMGAHVDGSLATQIAVGCLGNGFSGRLMKHVRDKLGLTYGIEAYVNTKQNTMHITSTFNPDLLKRGIEESRKIIDEWREGVTQKEIDIQKSILKGIRNVRFDNPSNIINSIHMYKLEGKDIQKMDDYEKEVDNITLEQVNKAINNVHNLTTVIVGSLKSV